MWCRLIESFPPMILLIVYLLSFQTQDTVAAHTKLKGLPSQRTRRQAGAPTPTDCRLGQWSEWTECFPCQEKKHRYRTLLHPAKYKGRICAGSLWEEVACRPTGTCAQSQECGTDFQCEETGRCLKRHLVCNGEPDCRDESDEAGCEDVERFCDDDLLPVPGISKAAQGYNILTQKRLQLVYDPTYYGGQCESVYNGEWRELKYDAACERLYYGNDEKYFRKPYNVHFYQFLAHADSGFSSEYYDDAKDLLKALKEDSSGGIGVTVGIGPAKGPVSLDLGYSASWEEGTLKNFTQYAAKNVGFIRALTKVQTAHFKMRREDIFLDEDMLQSLMELPDQYNYGLYAKFINDHGTHFMTSGTMGGIFEYILVVNKDEMRKKEVTSSMISFCSGLSVGISLKTAEADITLGARVSSEECSKEGDQAQDGSKTKSVIEDIIPRIRGGDTASASRLLGSWDANAYRYWGRSLKLNPTVIDFELQPIHEILRRTKLAYIETKRRNLKRALDEYLTEFNTCRCGPCQNNGEPMLIGSSCICECQQGSQGAACENTRRAGSPVHGMWNCWTPWTPCQSQSRRRTRQCTNPAPQNGGTVCAGRNVQTEAC
ncbi:complement component C8 alpha chain [Eublepharis macularius]|uniref:Complement component C8 alpha chain n=1 Tax=Eublepharis macularius TaxID=481883 RepID=A0AA97JI33_EUBMA|nr:complement component C8 alpha chain [Eublepharis macularius]